jgi:hypothetical protein
MTTRHHADGPGGLFVPGPGDLSAVFANDNRRRFPAAIAGACGLVLAAEHTQDGAALATIRALEADGTLGEAIHITEEPWDIIALWRGLGRDLGLPLYLHDATGGMTPVSPVAGEIIHAHHRGSALSGRRPRFLARRRMPLAAMAPAGKANKRKA